VLAFLDKVEERERERGDSDDEDVGRMK